MEKEEEIKELKDRLKLIEEYYEENSFIKRIKFYIRYIKEKWNANSTNNRNNDTSANNTICNDGTSNSWNNEINSLFNDKEIKK